MKFLIPKKHLDACRIEKLHVHVLRYVRHFESFKFESNLKMYTYMKVVRYLLQTLNYYTNFFHFCPDVFLQ